jgi:hypothetical protein
MERWQKILVLTAVVIVAAGGSAAYSTRVTPPEGLCIASGSATYRISPTTAAPDYRVRIDNGASHPDLRMQLVDSPELADIVLADDFAASGSTSCGSLPTKTVRLDTKDNADSRTPDVTVALTPDAATPDYRVYVHSVRFSHDDAAALLAATWKAAQKRELAAQR